LLFGDNLKIKSSFIALFLLQSFSPAQKQITLPEENIINYELTPEQENLLLQNGKTIAKFYYYSGCIECTNQLSFLESMANQFSNQIILQQVLSERASLTIIGYYGHRNLVNATQEEIFDVFCELMIDPPITCITRKV